MFLQKLESGKYRIADFAQATHEFRAGLVVPLGEADDGYVVRVLQAYRQAAPEIQDVVTDMLDVIDSPDATETDRCMAQSTVDEALFPASELLDW